MLNWFAENPARYWWLVCFAIIWTLFILLRPLLRPDWRDVKRTDWRWGLIILGVLFVGRWPTWFVTRQLNPPPRSPMYDPPGCRPHRRSDRVADRAP